MDKRIKKVLNEILNQNYTFKVKYTGIGLAPSITSYYEITVENWTNPNLGAWQSKINIINSALYKGGMFEIADNDSDLIVYIPFDDK